MKSIFLAVALTLVLGTAGPQAGATPPAFPVAEGAVPTLAPLLDKVTPGVVNISVKGHSAVRRQNPMFQDPMFRFFFGQPERQREPKPRMSAGSGVIVDAVNGYVMTNNHVIANAEEIVVTLKDRRKFEAKLVGSDKGTDIALLKIKPERLTAVRLGDSDALKVGDFVLAIGNPFGIGQTVTSGIVSALGRSGLNIEGYEDFIQTDASINPGNSGGALINLRGELIGINTAIIGPGGGNVGIGFAVPVRMAKAVMSQLLRYGEVRRGRLGVSIQDVTPDIAAAMKLGDNSGAIIARVDPKSPAAKAGIKAGDVVVALNGKALRGSSDLRNRVGLVPVGEEVTLAIVRNGKRQERKVTIADEAVFAATGKADSPLLHGAVIQNLPDTHALAGKLSGVIVARIEAGSPAWQRGLRAGDVILAVNQQPTPDLDAFRRAARRSSKVLAMNIVRDDTQLFLVIS